VPRVHIEMDGRTGCPVARERRLPHSTFTVTFRAPRSRDNHQTRAFALGWRTALRYLVPGGQGLECAGLKP
jgi:hypothetical protein